MVSPNLLTIGHGTLLNPKVTEDGYVEGVVYDKYDYKFEFKKYIKDLKGTTYNNGARILEKIKHLEDYYDFLPVRFRYEDYKEVTAKVTSFRIDKKHFHLYYIGKYVK